MSAHLIDGEFQSDKYPTCPRGKVPLSVKDKSAQSLLWEYAQRRRPVDAEFSDDLQAALRAAGFDPTETSQAYVSELASIFLERDELRALLSVSEKRAEEAERERELMRKEISSFDAQLEFLATVANKGVADAEAERDSSQASLLRVEAERNALKTAFRVNMLRGCAPATHEEIDFVIRTALSPHAEK